MLSEESQQFGKFFYTPTTPKNNFAKNFAKVTNTKSSKEETKDNFKRQ